jgi:hypothetical protein
MSSEQSRQNPDVNTFIIDDEGDQSETPNRDGESDTERVPVPPGSQPSAPIEEPPNTGGAPMGDVDDSPKRIAG